MGYNEKLYPAIADRAFKRFLWVEAWFFEFIVGLVRYGIPCTSTKKYEFLKRNDSLVIIANGPSISGQIEAISQSKNCDFACMNYFPLYSEYFDKLKPQYYFGTDVMLYDKKHPDPGKVKATKDLREIMNQINWNMIAFMYRDESLLLENKKIKEIRLTNYMIDGVYSRFRGFLFDHNLAVPETRTVAVYAIQTGIRLGYKKIYVYGVDMSQHEGVRIEKNKLSNEDIHFYDPDKKENAYKNDFVGICEANFFSLKSFRTLNKYANKKGCKVYNCSNHSYVDAFDRK
ncbi:MAG: hypothetical protein HFI35_02830 [Roseburia sp.]|jgi:hypothetical protein|nr:hypothetical protein [Roseburia sp.]